MASLSSGFEGLNLGAAQRNGDERTEVPAAEANLGAIPKRAVKKKSERSKNRSRKSDVASLKTSVAVSEACDPITDIPETINPLTDLQQGDSETKVEDSNPGAKKPSSQKRSRRGKRQLKTTLAENDHPGDKVLFEQVQNRLAELIFPHLETDWSCLRAENWDILSTVQISHHVWPNYYNDNSDKTFTRYYFILRNICNSFKTKAFFKKYSIES